LEDWRENHEKKLREPAEEIARRLARLQEVNYSLINLHRIWQKAGKLYRKELNGSRIAISFRYGTQFYLRETIYASSWPGKWHKPQNKQREQWKK
jgi:hypothetical protein